ncbi:MAG: tetratricopeptide repeat protein [bacterium]
MQIKKKMTRKQFLAQDDEVMSFMKKAVIWLKKNANLIIFGVIGIGVVAAAIWGIRYKKESDLRNSAKLLSEARASYYAKVEGEPGVDDLQSEKSFKNIKEKYTAAVKTLDQLLQLYPSSAHAEDALFLKADAYYHMGEYDKAILTYQQYLEKYKTRGAYSVEALSSTGYSYEAKGDYQEAARVFQKITDDYQSYLLRDSIFMELGRCYEQMKDWGKAKEVYQKVVANFSDSPLLKDAQEKLNKINSASAQAMTSAVPEPAKTGEASGTGQPPEPGQVSGEAAQTPAQAGTAPDAASKAPETVQPESGKAPDASQSPETAGKIPDTGSSVSGQGSASEKK